MTDTVILTTSSDMLSISVLVKKNFGEWQIHLSPSRIVFLRDITMEDVTLRYVGWLNDPEVNKYLESRFIEWNLESLSLYIKKVCSDPKYKLMAIISDDVHIGNIKIGPINLEHKFADMGIFIGDKKFWRQGLASKSICAAIQQARIIGLHKLTAGMYENNIASIKAFKNNGFIEEGRLLKHYLYNGKFVDAIITGRMLNERK